MSWRAASSFPYKVSRLAQSKQAMPSKYRRERRMRVVSLATPSPEFSSPMSWRRESRSHLQLRHCWTVVPSSLVWESSSPRRAQEYKAQQAGEVGFVSPAFGFTAPVLAFAYAKLGNYQHEG